MNTQDNTPYDNRQVNSLVEAALRIGLIFALLALTYGIARPFFSPVAWGAILAVALMPLTLKVKGWLGGRQGLAATLVSLVSVALLLMPAVLITESLIESGTKVATAFNEGNVNIDPPPAQVAEWPVIGETVYGAWNLANTNLEAALKQFQPQLRTVASWMLGAIGNSALGILLFIVSLLIAGLFMAKSAAMKQGLDRFAIRMLGDDGHEWVDMCAATVRSVVQGVLGVALIQALLSAVGLFLMDVPAAGVWVVLILIMAIMQLPAFLVLGPIIAYVFSYADTTPAIIFAIYTLIVALSDNFLKPMLLGRGLDVPMPVILIGAIGGMMLAGIIGLFSGAVVMAIWYRLFVFWLDTSEEQTATPPAES